MPLIIIIILLLLNIGYANEPLLTKEPLSASDSTWKTNSNKGLATGIIYYVSPEGDWENSGLSKNDALPTIQGAFDLLESGDKLVILPGVYHEECYFDKKNYTKKVVIEAEKGAILDGMRNLYEGVIVENSSNIEICGLEITNYKCAAINVLYSTNISLSNNLVHHNGFDSSDYEWDHEGYGINLKYSSYIVAKSNTVNNNGPSRKIIDKYGKLGTGINTYELSNSRIIKNHSFDNIGGGILVEDGVNVLVMKNTVSNHLTKAYLDPEYPEEGQWWCGGIWIDGGHSIYTKDNSFIKNIAGILISNLDQQNPYNYLLENNRLQSNIYGIEISDFTQPLKEDIIAIRKNTFIDNAHNLYFEE